MTKKANRKEKGPKGFDDFEIISPDISYWNPRKEGEELVGEYIESYEGTNHTRYIVVDKDKHRWILPDALYIRNLFKEGKILEGDIVKVLYLSKTVTDKGKRIYDYRVGVGKGRRSGDD